MQITDWRDSSRSYQFLGHKDLDRKGEDGHMRSQIGLLSLVGLLSLLATADARTPSRFDGTYRLVSAAKVNQTYRSREGRMLLCWDRTPGPLTIANGHAKYTTETGHELSGTVGPNGELDLRMMA